jgi:hypothetical protein
MAMAYGTAVVLPYNAPASSSIRPRKARAPNAALRMSRALSYGTGAPAGGARRSFI